LEGLSVSVFFRLLLENHPEDVNALDPKDRTPLHLAFQLKAETDPLQVYQNKKKSRSN
jgi:hypothetical protein